MKKEEDKRTVGEIIMDWLGQLDDKIERINKRTKNHTLYIQEIKRKIKKMEKNKNGKTTGNRL